MKANVLCEYFAKELEMEEPASRKCVERIPMELNTWKPHERSMQMGYLALLVAEIPLWITKTIEDSAIDFATYNRFQPKSTAELVKHLDECFASAKRALKNFSDEGLNEIFYLKNKGETLMSIPKLDSVSSSINHLAHHRGQLTVYMRLNNIPVPSIYGPSADERGF